MISCRRSLWFQRLASAATINQLSGLQVNSRGFLTGSIDLVFSDADDPSSLVGGCWTGKAIGSVSAVAPLAPVAVGPAITTRKRWTSRCAITITRCRPICIWWPCTDICNGVCPYVPERHLGGYVYVFLRGMPGKSADDSVAGAWSHR